jgi:D-alanyl-D-alanine dipeptidase
MLDANSEARLAEVHPKVAELVRSMADRLAVESITVRVTQGLRSWAQQQTIWLEGRDEAGNIVDPSKVVTNAPPGHSWHSFGLAVDLAPFEGNIPDWNVTHPAWKRIVEIGESLGLTAGAEWHHPVDEPHFQLTGRFGVSPDDEVRELFQSGGISAVWAAADLEA